MPEENWKRMFEDLDRTYAYFTREYHAIKKAVGTIDSQPVIFESRVRLLAEELESKDKQLAEQGKDIARLETLVSHYKDSLIRDERWMNWSTAMWAIAVLLSYWLPYFFGRT